MAYKEIYPIENTVERLSKQLDEVLERKPTMYSKTKDKYKAMACSLLQSVEKISAILEEESLISVNSDEFNELSSDRIDLSKVSELVNDIQDSSDSSDSNKDIIKNFAQVFDEASTHNFGWYEVNECASLINEWFQTRFVPQVRNDNFIYNINQLPIWIAYIIIGYGKYSKENKLPSYLKMFRQWLQNIQSDSSNNWALPYVVYKLSKSTDAINYTMDAVIIADILMDEVYFQLTPEYLSDSKVVLDSNFVVSIIKKNNPGLLNKIRTRLSKRSELIKEIQFVPEEKGESDV